MGDVRIDPPPCVTFLAEFFRGTKETVELRALPSKRRIFTHRRGEARNFIEAHAHENLYFGVATRNGGGDKAHCREISALWADIDFKVTPKERAREMLVQSPIQHSVLIDSGAGLHPYWLLAKPATASDSSDESILHGLAAVLGGDRAAAEIARTMRLPGTLNWKYTPAHPCRILEADWARRYTLADFEKFGGQSRGPANVNSDETGKIRQGHRNSFLMSLAGSLRHRRMDEATITVVLVAVDRERCEPPLPESEVPQHR